MRYAPCDPASGCEPQTNTISNGARIKALIDVLPAQAECHGNEDQFAVNMP